VNPAASLPAAAPSAAVGRRTGPTTAVVREIRDHVRRHAPMALHPSRWTTRGRAFATLLVLFLVLSALVVIPNSPVLRLDTYLLDSPWRTRHHSWRPWVLTIVGFGQRWIVTYALQVIIVWAAFRSRSLRPLVMFATALILLNGSVGVVKYGFGRIGPAHQSNVHDIFVVGGNIFPSGHVSNAVVMYGVLAWALPPLRRALVALAVVISLAVGIGTVFLRTHWFSDVVGGWIAGGLVLLALPTFMPWAERFADQLVAWIRGALSTRPRLHHALSACVAWGRRVIPADPHYWDAGPGRHRRRAGDDWTAHRVRGTRPRGPVVRVAVDPHARSLPTSAAVHAGTARPAPASEFDNWPDADPSRREREPLTR
jgi:membrane-associated phospholipid phosphatase